MVKSSVSDGPDWLFVGALIAITMIGPLTVHMFLPAIPAVQKAFGVSGAMAQATFSVALFTMAFATLLYGSMSDRFGRRPVLLAGLALFAVGAAIGAAAPDIWTLIAGRSLQAAGAACGMVLARAMMRDIYGIDRLVKAIAYLTAAYVLGPMFAPPLGGVLIDAFGWRSGFIFAAVCGVALLALAVMRLPETHHDRVSSRGLSGVAANYRLLLRSPRFCGFALQPGFASGGFFAHASTAAFLMTDVMGYSASEFGLWFMFFPVGFMSGNLIAGRLAAKVPVETMVVVGCVISLGAAFLMAAMLGFGSLTPLALFLPGGLHTFGQGLSQPNSQTGAIATQHHLAGTASGVVVFLQLAIGAVLSQLVAVINDGTPYPMLVILTIASALSLAVGSIPAMMRHRDAGEAV